MEFDANEQALRESGRYPWNESASSGGGLLDWLSGARGRTRDASEATQRRAIEARDATGAYIRRYPFATVTLALLVGFAAGVLIARR